MVPISISATENPSGEGLARNIPSRAVTNTIAAIFGRTSWT
jgi:hypothetical protein